MTGPLFLLFIGVMLTIIIVACNFTGWVVWYQKRQQRRKDQQAIREAVAFMGKWKVYDQKKADEAPLPIGNSFAAKVDAIKQKARAQGDPYAFDKAVREMVYGPVQPRATDEEVIARVAKHFKENEIRKYGY
jgi:hypothetical protein